MIVIYHCFMRQNVHLMLSTFNRCMGITCNIWGRAQDPTQLTHTLRGGGKHATGYRALIWQLLLSDDYADTLGDYDIIFYLPRKAALFLFEFHDTDFRVTVPGLPPLPAPQARDEYLDVHGIVHNEQITELLATLKSGTLQRIGGISDFSEHSPLATRRTLGFSECSAGR